MSDKNIVLTGFMATGKSTVGQIVATELGRVFYDVDTAIEHRTGLTIPRIFAEHSEPFFRAIEKGICHEVALQKNMVIATGGGAIIDEDSRNTLLKNSFVVCLIASPEHIESRLQQFDSRPLRGRWRELLEARMPIYQSLPNIINTSDLEPQQVAEEVIQLWQNESA